MLLIYSNAGRWAGGVEVLVARFASYLLSIEAPFVIVEPLEGWMRSAVPQAQFIQVEDLPGIAPKITHTFVPSIMGFTDSSLPWKWLAETRVFTLVLHPNDIFFCYFPNWDRPFRLLGYKAIPVLRGLFRSHEVVYKRLFQLMMRNDAFAVMDGATSRASHYFLPFLEGTLDVVPIPSIPLDCKWRIRNVAEFNVGYLGRMDRMKWSAFEPFLRSSLAPIARKRKVNLIVVTGDSNVDMLKDLCVRLGINLEHHPYLPNEKARILLVERCDIAVAMGTSALDLAGSGLPTVVINPALGRFAGRQKNFRYIHDTQDWTLGEYRDSPGYVDGHATFDELCSQEALSTASADGIHYVKMQHDAATSFKKLYSLIFGSTMQLSDLCDPLHQCLDSFSRARRQPIREIASNFLPFRSSEPTG